MWKGTQIMSGGHRDIGGVGPFIEGFRDIGGFDGWIEKDFGYGDKEGG